jgi:ribosomal protein L40E
MTNDSTVTCPECQQGQLLDTGDGTLVCLSCGERFLTPQRVCPFCDAENELDARACQQCGRALRRVCPRCQTVNPIKAEVCLSCQLAFDTIGHIAAREELRHTDRFSRMAGEISSVKAAEQSQSQQRMDQMWATEQQRRAGLAQQQRVQRQQELRLMYAALILLALAVVAVVVIALLSARG